MTGQDERWALAVHGGAKEIEPGEEEAHRKGCLEALAAGREILERGGSAIDAVEAAVRVLERDPTFNAGRGSELNQDDEVEMCSGIMRGSDLAVGAVGVIKDVCHPVSVAKMILDEDWVLISGEGATRFARERGAELCRQEDLITEKKLEAADAHDTVGAVALDQAGNLAAATSTGGLTGQPPGRMGDSALPGGGYFADNHVGAVVLTGDGESLARIAAASQVMHRLPELGPEKALQSVLERLPHMGGDGGGVAVTKQGAIGWWHNSPHLSIAAASSEEPESRAWLSKEEK